MKTTNPSLPLLVIFLLSALAANPLLLDASAADAARSFRNPVLDIDGDVVMPDQPYYIVSTVNGGLRVDCTNKTGTTCPLDIVQMIFYLDYGLPFSFSLVNKFAARFVVVVQESTDLNIISPGVNNCSIHEYSTMWGIEYDKSKRKHFVTTCAPAKGNPAGCGNWFQLKKVTYLAPLQSYCYKIVFCPKVHDNSIVVCKDIGIYYDADGTRRLVLSNHPTFVVFRKASGRVPTITTVNTMISKEN